MAANRPFQPTLLARDPNMGARLVERRLENSGQYVRHFAPDGTSQFVVMNYQFIPVDASINPDFAITGTDPKLWGHVDHFDVQPALWVDGDSFEAGTGSKFEVDGWLYLGKKVNIKHGGQLYVELIRDDKCAEQNPDFCAEVEALLCSSEPN